MRRPYLIVGALLIASAGLWRFWIAQRWIQRLPPGWQAAARYIGTLTYPDPKTGRLPETDALADYHRTQRLVTEPGRPGVVLLEDAFQIRDVATGALTWEYVTRTPVDPKTGALVEPQYLGDIAVFPRGVRKTTYRLRSNYLEGMPVPFVRGEVLDGLPTYLFAYRGKAEYTKSYAGTPGYPGIKVPPGQEIRCADDQFFLRAWVEPETGELVKLEEGCPSGDFLFERGSDRRHGAVVRWGGVTAGDVLIERIEQVRRQRAQLLWASRYVPALLLLAGLSLTAVGLAPRRRTVPS